MPTYSYPELVLPRNLIFLKAAASCSEFIHAMCSVLQREIEIFQEHLDEVIIDVNTLQIIKKVENPSVEALTAAQNLVDALKAFNDEVKNVANAPTSEELRDRLENLIRHTDAKKRSLQELSRYTKYLNKHFNVNEAIDVIRNSDPDRLEDILIERFGTKAAKRSRSAQRRKKIGGFILCLALYLTLHSKDIVENVCYTLGLPMPKNFPELVIKAKELIENPKEQAEQAKEQKAISDGVHNPLRVAPAVIEKSEERVDKAQ